jgi:hypothetical protein
LEKNISWCGFPENKSENCTTKLDFGENNPFFKLVLSKFRKNDINKNMSAIEKKNGLINS